MTAASLALGSVTSFAQNKQDMTRRSAVPAIPAIYQKMDTIYQMMVHAQPDKNTMATENKGQIGAKDILHWTDIHQEETEEDEVYLFQILEQAKEEHKRYFGFQARGKDYFIPITNLEKMNETNKAYYAHGQIKKDSAAISFLATEEMDFRNGKDHKSALTTISTESLTNFSQEHIETIIAHEAGHTLNQSRLPVPVLHEYYADLHALRMVGAPKVISALLAYAGYINKCIETATDPQKKEELLQIRAQEFDFGQLGLNDHACTGNRIQYAMAYETHGANVLLPPSQHFEPQKKGAVRAP